MDIPRIKPDWLSWTVIPQVAPGHRMDDHHRQGSFNLGYERLGLKVSGKPTAARRKPYTLKYDIEGGMGALFFNPKLDYCTAELTGRGCTMTMKDDGFDMIAEAAEATVTRFDVAIDFDTKVNPIEFVDAGISSRIRTKSVITSDSGETVYIGSPKSDFFCRVYKYNPPHERAGLLRVELVARRKVAKIAIGLWLSDGPLACVAYLAKPFAFEHSIWANGSWQGYVVDAKVERVRSISKTRAWLIKQVKPALRRLALEGELDAGFMGTFLEGMPHVTVEYVFDDKHHKDTRTLPIKEGEEQPFKGML